MELVLHITPWFYKESCLSLGSLPGACSLYLCCSFADGTFSKRAERAAESLSWCQGGHWPNWGHHQVEGQHGGDGSVLQGHQRNRAGLCHFVGLGMRTAFKSLLLM